MSRTVLLHLALCVLAINIFTMDKDNYIALAAFFLNLVFMLLNYDKESK